MNFLKKSIATAATAVIVASIGVTPASLFSAIAAALPQSCLYYD